MSGFHFTETPPPMLLNTAMERENRITVPHVNHCTHPGKWVLDYSVTDCGLVKTEFTSWLPRPGGIGHLYPPGRRYYEDFRERQNYRSAYLIFEGENPVLRKLTENSGGFARILDPERRIQKYLQGAAAAASRGSRGYWESCSWFCKILGLLERLPPSGKPDYLYEPGGDAAAGNLSDRVKEYLEQNFKRQITVKMIARALGVSESGLSHRYRQESGETLFDTLLRIRVEQSLPLLQSGKRLKNIAPEVGFSNEFYYSRIFKRIYGKPPKSMIHGTENISESTSGNGRMQDTAVHRHRFREFSHPAGKTI